MGCVQCGRVHVVDQKGNIYNGKRKHREDMEQS